MAPVSAADFPLKPHPSIAKPDGPVLVCILDGFGYNTEDQWNAIHVADTPVYDRLKKLGSERFRTVKAHGTAVGLPSDADMGNSEVGHNALGSGQVVDQGARLVDIALEDGSAWSGDGFNHIKPSFADNTVHFIGLLSDGGVHSRYDQLIGFVKGVVKRGAKRVRVHVLTDGRDVPDGTSKKFVTQLQEDLAAVSKDGVDARIASGGGRMCVTMDRYEADWRIVERGWNAHVLGHADHTFKDALTAVTTLRGGEDKPITDQWLPPFVIVDDEDKPVGPIEDGDAVVLFNFRSDRMVEISKAFEYEDFKAFDRKRFPKTRFVGMMQYDGDLKLPAMFLVPPPAINHVSGQYLAANGVSTFACSETQKFGHVTFFWNGNRSGYFSEDLETFVEIPSDDCPFNEAPDMKAFEITEAGKEALLSKRFQMVRVNYANPDMARVGHTGDLKAVVRACTTVDRHLGDLLETVEKMGGRWLVSSDHGNADDMVQRHKKTGEALMDDSGRPLALTSHTLAAVPIAIGGKGLPEGVVFRDDMPDAGLANVTATYVNLLGYEAPECWVPSLLTVKA